MRTLIHSLFVASLVLGAGCGGGPKYKIDDAVLADIPVAEKDRILAAQSEMNTATEEQNKAKSDLAVVERDVSVADSEYGQAKLDVNKAEADLALAQSTKDMNRVTSAQATVAQTKLARDVADAKLDWQKERRRFAKAILEQAEQHYYASAARYEQEKARLAEAKGRKPDPKFTVASFDQQAAEKQSKFDSAKMDADKQRLATSQAESKYNQLLQKLDMMRQSAASQNPTGGAVPPM